MRILTYQTVEAGPPVPHGRLPRRALGAKATGTPPAEAGVKGLLAEKWGFFLADPDSSLANELTGNFATVFNECDFDMVYFDASDGTLDAYLDNWYYQNKLHLGFYRKFRRTYYTRPVAEPARAWCGTSFPASASADGHGDLKRYLDERLPGMLGMEADFTRPDVGWYYMYTDVRPDQIEYVCAKTIGLDGSISIETSQDAMEKHPRARQMMEMLGRYEECRLAGFFPENVQAILPRAGQGLRTLAQRRRLETLPRGLRGSPVRGGPRRPAERVDDHQRAVRGGPALRGDCLRLPQNAHGRLRSTRNADH